MHQVIIRDKKSILLNDGLSHVPQVGYTVTIKDVHYKVVDVRQIIKANPLARAGYSEVVCLFEVKVKRKWWQKNVNANRDSKRGLRGSGRDSSAEQEAGSMPNPLYV